MILFYMSFFILMYFDVVFYGNKNDIWYLNIDCDLVNIVYSWPLDRPMDYFLYGYMIVFCITL